MLLLYAGASLILHLLAHCRQHATQFAQLYDLGVLDFVSVRWEGTRNTITWRVPLDRLDMSSWLPIFVSGLAEAQVHHVTTA